MINKKYFFQKVIMTFIVAVIFASCGVSTGEVVSAGENDNMPVLQICPPVPEAPSVSGEDGVDKNSEDPMKDFYNMFADPVSIEESNNNIIVVETDADNVEVYLNNMYMGKSKITIKDLTPGQYILDLKKAGYEDFRTYVGVNRNRKNYYFFNMTSKNN